MLKLMYLLLFIWIWITRQPLHRHQAGRAVERARARLHELGGDAADRWFDLTIKKVDLN